MGCNATSKEEHPMIYVLVILLCDPSGECSWQSTKLLFKDKAACMAVGRTQKEKTDCEIAQDFKGRGE